MFAIVAHHEFAAQQRAQLLLVGGPVVVVAEDGFVTLTVPTMIVFLVSSNKPEAKFKAEIRKNIVGPHWQSIESWIIGAGIPDLNACYHGKEIWIECKIHPRKPTPKQINWWERRHAAGGRVFLMVKKGDEIIIWRKGADIPFVSLKPHNWETIRQVLFA